MNHKKLLCVVAFILLLISGCSVLNDLWPTQVPKAAITYLDKDPNTSTIQTFGKAKEMQAGIISKNLETQLGLEYQMSLDRVRYEAALEQIKTNIETAKVERDKMIGKIESPGWLLSILLGASGLGLYITGAKTQRPEDYNENEVEVEVKKRVVAELAATKTGSQA